MYLLYTFEQRDVRGVGEWGGGGVVEMMACTWARRHGSLLCCGCRVSSVFAGVSADG